MAKMTGRCTPNAPFAYHFAVTARAFRGTDARLGPLVNSYAPYSAVESIELNCLLVLALSC